MKKIVLLSAFLIVGLTHAQIDRSKQPKSGPAPEINLESPQQFSLKNGLTVLVVENNKLPRVSIRLSIDNPLLVEGDKAGVRSLLTQMMGKGSKTISKDDFNEEIDFMGARLFFNSNGAVAGSLTRYFPRVLEMMADAAMNPNFLQEEFEKERDILLEGIKSQEKDVKAAARRVENLLSYGAQHPSGEFVNKESVESVSLADIKQWYKKVFLPNKAYLVVVGDVEFKTVKKQITKAFKTWEEGTLAESIFPEPVNAETVEIDFVEMPNAVQSEISVVNTASLKKADPDYFPVIIANQILGGGAEARLFLNLREDKGFTYGSYSRFSNSHKTKARFRAFASVRNAVTDSSVVELLYEIDKLRNEPVTDDELKAVKAKYAGNFVLSLEDPENIGNYTLNIITENLPADFYQNFLKRINAVTKEDVQRVAKKYFLSDQARVVVTGKGADVLSKLEAVTFKGKPVAVRYFDKYGTETERPTFSKPIPEGTTVQTVMEGYLKAIGGREKLESVVSLSEVSEGTVQGMTLQMERKKTNQNQMLLEVKMMGNVMQKVAVNKDAAYMEMQGQKIPMEGAELEGMIADAAIFPELNLDPNSLTLVGIVEVDGVDAYEVKVSDKKTLFFDAATFYKIKSIETAEMMGQSTTSMVSFGDYKEVDGVMIPHKVSQSMGPQSVDFMVQSCVLNASIDSAIFE